MMQNYMTGILSRKLKILNLFIKYFLLYFLSKVPRKLRFVQKRIIYDSEWKYFYHAFDLKYLKSYFCPKGYFFLIDWKLQQSDLV